MVGQIESHDPVATGAAGEEHPVHVAAVDSEPASRFRGAKAKGSGG